MRTEGPPGREGMDKSPPDWSVQCAPRIKNFVSKNACPTCHSRAGMPCKNTNAELPEAWELFPEKAKKRKQKRRLFYFNKVHAARKKL